MPLDLPRTRSQEAVIALAILVQQKNTFFHMFSFTGDDQVVRILRKHNMAVRQQETMEGAVSSRCAPLDPSEQNKVWLFIVRSEGRYQLDIIQPKCRVCC